MGYNFHIFCCLAQHSDILCYQQLIPRCLVLLGHRSDCTTVVYSSTHYNHKNQLGHFTH